MIALENILDMAVRYVEEGYGVSIELIDGGYVDISYVVWEDGVPEWALSSCEARRYPHCVACVHGDALHVLLSGGEWQPTLVRVHKDRISSVSPTRASPSEAWIRWRQSQEWGL